MEQAGPSGAPLEWMARAYIGTSGWVYPGWRKHLYLDTPVRRWLEVASRTFDALEINGSFYTQIKHPTYARWRRETPEGFRFALKGHRYVTHYKRLGNCEKSIVLLRDQARGLGDKLRAVVWQLPATFGLDLGRLEDFLRSLGQWAEVRHALELRHPSWFVEPVADRLREAQVAVCLSDAPDFPMWRAVTTDFVYVRLHGHTRKYASSYNLPHLKRWTVEIDGWLDEGREVHVYFDNDAEGHAVRNALTLRALLNGAPPRAHRRVKQLPAGTRRGASWSGLRSPFASSAR